mmetsp:Transcript_17971/g.15890  ORF Transcript_17971/g.15890 Transcript_17971/m.15890 type:complete len:102 (+) Transcript_17971:943-1248(+)
MRLEFNYGKLGIRDMNKLLYKDFISFASTPREKSGERSNLSMYAKPPRVSGYKEFYTNRKSLKPSYGIEKNEVRAKLKSRLTIDQTSDSSALYSQLQNMLE